MSDSNCILCKSDKIRNIQTLSTSDLVKLYASRAGVQVERLFKQDTINYVECHSCGLKFYLPQAIGDGQFYDELQQYQGYYLEEKQEYIEAAKFIRPTDTVLEIGAGEGIFTRHIKYGSYIGLEFSEKAIQTAAINGIQILNEDILSYSKTHPEQFDVVCFFQVLEHVENPNEFLIAALKCLKKGGRLILAVPSEDSFIRNVVNFYLNMPPHHASRWTDDTLRKIAELFNLKLVHLFHEYIHPMHQEFYNKTRIHSLICKRLGLIPKMVDLGMINYFTYGLSTIASRFSPPNNKEIGQSVMVVYEKQQ